MKYLFPIVLVALLMTACQSQSSENENTSTPTIENSSAVENASEMKSDKEDGNVPALNPEHGQLGHRCDIPVGAPLVAKEKPVDTQIRQLNPEHGQPGHRCDIPVGAPLG